MNYKILSLSCKRNLPLNFDKIPVDRKKMSSPFKKTLTTIWDKYKNIGVQKPINPVMLSIGCGRSFETTDLFQFYGDTLKFYGIDIDREEIRVARSILTPKYESNSEFILGIGSDDESLSKIEPYNLLWIRHPNTYKAKENWIAVFENSFEKLLEGGTFSSSYYFEKDYIVALDIFHELGLSVDIAFKNDNCVPIHEVVDINFAHDNYVISVHKPFL
ncbi:methyltransferase domain-containing protein [bacterium]|jgi:hypothetical protein|nr:methyltransferase domain-containing protein [bacterium]